MRTALAFFIVVAISQIYPLHCKDKNSMELVEFVYESCFIKISHLLKIINLIFENTNRYELILEVYLVSS